MIAAARDMAGKSIEDILTAMDAAARTFGQNAEAKFGRRGEWR
jgi:hypothetical protein